MLETCQNSFLVPQANLDKAVSSLSPMSSRTLICQSIIIQLFSRYFIIVDTTKAFPHDAICELVCDEGMKLNTEK